MFEKLKWAEMTPDELDLAVKTCPLVYCPVGSLEWHGPHLPLATDSYRAEIIAIEAARRTGGVVLPPLWVTAPGFAAYCGSITFSPRLVEAMVDELHREVEKVGFRLIVHILGHAGHAQDYCFRSQNRKSTPLGKLRVMTLAGFTKKTGLSDLGLQHAGGGEAAQAMAAAPETVRLDLFDPQATTLPRYEGLDPAVYADGLPDEQHRLVAGHISRTNWTWDADLAEKANAPGIAEKSVRLAAEVVAQEVEAALAEVMGQRGQL
ncbi:creatininase family protein [bacterium]|nr:creatininase family protein [bacterium]